MDEGGADAEAEDPDAVDRAHRGRRRWNSSTRERPFGVNAIARRLGVTPSSLYNHVAGRDEIIELMRGRLGEHYMSTTLAGTWDEVVEAMLRAERRMYADHPFLIPLIVGKTITDPTVIASYDRLPTTLAAAGFPDDDVLEVVAIIDAFSIGFGLDLASPDDVWRPETPTETLGRLVEAGPRGRRAATGHSSRRSSCCSTACACAWRGTSSTEPLSAERMSLPPDMPRGDTVIQGRRDGGA